MNEKKLLQAIEEDTRKEYEAILKNAGIEAEAIVKAAEEEMEKVKEQRLEQAKAFLHQERLKKLAGAKMYAAEVLLKERQAMAAKALNEVNVELKRLRSGKEYPAILKRFFKESMDEWRILVKEEKALAVVSAHDYSLLKEFAGEASCEIAADETGSILSGVIIMSKDKKNRIVNTFDSRLEKAKTELVSVIDRALFIAN